MSDHHQYFIGYLREEHPGVWAALQRAELDGLVSIDDVEDSICPTNRLLLTYPDLHEIIVTMINQWAESNYDQHDTFADLLGSQGCS